MARKVVPRASSERTREKILAVAERLFASSGFGGVSMREVGTEADVPFALVTYHFGTKLGLYKAVFDRRSGTMAKERFDRLLAIRLGDDPRANFIAIARALVEPSLRLREVEGGKDFGRLMAREATDCNEAERGILAQHFDPIAAVAIEILQKAAPDAPRSRIVWAYHFAVSALGASHADTGRIERISNNLCQSDNLDEFIEEMTRFVTAGLMGALRPDLMEKSAKSPKRKAAVA